MEFKAWPTEGDHKKGRFFAGKWNKRTNLWKQIEVPASEPTWLNTIDCQRGLHCNEVFIAMSLFLVVYFVYLSMKPVYNCYNDINAYLSITWPDL